MITNDGKEVVAKFLLGQVPDFASYIAAGCGANPEMTGSAAYVDPNKKSLDFEMFRVPVLSKGLIKEDGQEKMVFRGEIPSGPQYNISEIAVFSAENNNIARNYDSKLLLTFSDIEAWSYIYNGTASAVEYYNSALDLDNEFNNISINASAAFINSNSSVFRNQDRENKKESPRYLSRSLMVPGNFSNIDNEFEFTENSYYLENEEINFDFSKNSLEDEIKIVFSLVSKDSDNYDLPDNVKIVIELVNGTSLQTSLAKAKLNIEILGVDFENSRYITITKKIKHFQIDQNFSFANINIIKIYLSVIEEGAPSENYFGIFDGIRIDNVSTINPLYAMTGYTIVQTQDGLPISKSENVSGYLEYRFGIGVQ
jgi:hypothetical protein